MTAETTSQDQTGRTSPRSNLATELKIDPERDTARTDVLKDLPGARTRSSYCAWCPMVER